MGSYYDKMLATLGFTLHIATDIFFWQICILEQQKKVGKKKFKKTLLKFWENSPTY